MAKRRCDVHGCRARARWWVEGTPFKVCGWHHPMIGKRRPSHLDVVAAHQLHVRSMQGLNVRPTPRPSPRVEDDGDVGSRQRTEAP
jgi:hypothetical protein